MRLRAKPIDIDAGDVLVAVMNADDAKELRVFPGSRIEIRARDRKVEAVVDVSKRFVNKGEIGLFIDLFEALGEYIGEVEVEPSVSPRSVSYIREKIDGKRLNREKIYEIVKDIIENRITSSEASAFVTACYINGLSLKETVFLTEAIVETGEKVEISKGPVVDKHCIGGVPNNRTTMIFVPVLASIGYYVPKTSSRAITSPAGTADTMEVLAKVDLKAEEIKEITESVGGVIAWGGGTGIAAADDRLVTVRRPLSLDPKGILLASIMAKKKAVSSKHVIVDIPVGPEAKIKSVINARRLGKMFVSLGKQLGMDVYVVITDGCFPIGNGVGPALEAKDVLSVLNGNGPKDLMRKAAELTSYLLCFYEKIPQPDAYKKVVEQISSGRALKKFKEIVDAQEGDPDINLEDIPVGKYREEITSDKNGKVDYISSKAVSAVARTAGAPFDKGAGVYLHKKQGEKVSKGEKLFTVFSESKKKLKCALELAGEVYTVK